MLQATVVIRVQSAAVLSGPDMSCAMHVQESLAASHCGVGEASHGGFQTRNRSSAAYM